jgi:FtsZ-binding cell division protein ZapB
MSMADPFSALKMELQQNAVPQILRLLTAARSEGLPVHEVERGLWELLLQVGRSSLSAFLDSHGTGDLGETVTLPDGQECHRLENLHSRRYVSIFGAFELQRTVYGSWEGQTLDFVPLDNRLQLPASVFSYVLQDWDQSLAVEQAFSQVNQTIARILHLQQSVDSLEEMNRQLARHVADFRDLQGSPPAAEEGEIVVVTADCKGIVIRGQGTPTVCGGERPGGQRANQKRMATVGAVYTVDPYVRTPADVVAALFRDADYQAAPRPEPCHKRIWASLPKEGPEPRSSIDVVFDWLWWEFAQRNPRLDRPTVCLCDGQEALWQACADGVWDEQRVDILDLLHVTPRLWAAAKLLYGDKGPEVLPFVRQRVLQVLEGKVETVVRTLRRLAVERELSGAKKKAMSRLCSYLHKNRQRMRYDHYLREGYPIASGIIEGACRHLIKDRMERAGMHWTLAGAQAMLDLRSVWIGNQWEAFQKQRIKVDTERLYPHRNLVAGEAFLALAA